MPQSRLISAGSAVSDCALMPARVACSVSLSSSRGFAGILILPSAIVDLVRTVRDLDASLRVEERGD